MSLDANRVTPSRRTRALHVKIDPSTPQLAPSRAATENIAPRRTGRQAGRVEACPRPDQRWGRPAKPWPYRLFPEAGENEKNGVGGGGDAGSRDSDSPDPGGSCKGLIFEGLDSQGPADLGDTSPRGLVAEFRTLTVVSWEPQPLPSSLPHPESLTGLRSHLVASTSTASTSSSGASTASERAIDQESRGVGVGVFTPEPSRPSTEAAASRARPIPGEERPGPRSQDGSSRHAGS